MKRIGFVTALAAEAACLGRTPPPDSPYTLDDQFSMVLCGSGSEHAKHGAELLIKSGAAALVSFGFAGALSGTLRPGQLLLPNSVIASGQRVAPTETWRRQVLERLNLSRRHAHEGPMAESNRILADAPAKAEWRRITNADTVDMESVAILEVARQRNVPALVLRVVVDSADMEIPDPVLRACDVYGRVRPLSLIGDLLRRPKFVPALLRLAVAYRAATGTLRWLARQRGILLVDGEPT